MLGYTIRRALLAVFVLWGVVTVVFIIVRLVPADPAVLVAGMDATPEQVAAIRTRMGLDQPLILQYLGYVGGILRGDFGSSYTFGTPAMDLVMKVLPNTALLAFLGCLLAVVVSFPLGLLAALRVNRPTDRIITTASLFTQALPGFWVGVVLMLVFSQTLRLLPSTGFGSPAALVLPVVTVALPFIAILTRMTRSGLLEVAGEGYVATARAKGLSERIVIFTHSARNALIPVVTLVGLEFGALLGGAVVTETVFSFPGVGKLLVSSILARDYNLVQACVIIIASAFVVVNLLVDLLYGYLDPRVRFAK